MNYSVFMVDDEVHCRNGLRKMLDTYCENVKIVGEASNVDSAIEYLSNNKVDIVFLDVEMSGRFGFEVIEELEEIDFELIFVTAHDGYALKAIKYAALDYLLKPVDLQELRVAFRRATANRDNKYRAEQINIFKETMTKRQFDRIALTTSTGLKVVDVKDIVKCVADGSYCNVFLENGKQILLSKPLGALEDILPDNHFVRVHKSSIANINYVVEYVSGKGGYLVLKDGSHLDVSVRRREALMNALPKV